MEFSAYIYYKLAATQQGLGKALKSRQRPDEPTSPPADVSAISVQVPLCRASSVITVTDSSLDVMSGRRVGRVRVHYDEFRVLVVVVVVVVVINDHSGRRRIGRRGRDSGLGLASSLSEVATAARLDRGRLMHGRRRRGLLHLQLQMARRGLLEDVVVEGGDVHVVEHHRVAAVGGTVEH
ncbi:hypothetical protein TKK_0005677 [Trichogramma kaykai]